VNENTSLDDLLSRWQQAHREGQTLSLEELCSGCPERVEELKRHLRELAAMQAFLGLESTPPLGSTLPAEPPGAATAAPAQAGRFRILGEIARGGMGAVLRAHDPALGRDVAIKVILAGHRDDPMIVRRFFDEARLAGQLQHPGVAPVYDLGELPDRRPFFAMKLIEGRTLAALLRERKDPTDDLPRFLRDFEAVCQAVGYAHSKGIIHRDLKPLNVMVGAFGEVQVMDWGLAKVLRRDDEASAHASGRLGLPATEGAESQAGAVVGTPGYMAPEQVRSETEHIGPRSDVFGLGAILCDILTGAPPFRGKGLMDLLTQAARGDLADACARLDACGADGELVRLAKACLAAEPGQRPADGAAVAAGVAAYLEGVQERLRQAEIARARADAERRRRRAQLALLGSLLVLVLLGGGGAWLFQQREQTRAREVERQQRAADGAAAQAMAEARVLLAQARAEPLREANRFGEALAAARKADELARTGGASDAVQREAAALASAVGKEEQGARNDRRLLAAALEVRRPRETPVARADERGSMIQDVEPSADEQFASAFRAWGLEVDATPTAAAAARLGARPPAVVAEVVAALDDWAGERRGQRRPAVEWRRLVDLAEALDRPDSRRRELRTLLFRGELARERVLGILSMALRPVPIPFDAGIGGSRERLRRLAANMDAATEPVLGVLTLVRALRLAGDDRLAEQWLQAAVRARPQQVVLHQALGRFLTEQPFPRWAQATRSYEAARALRPELGLSLAQALVQSGSEEGLPLYERLAMDNPDNPWIHFHHGYALTREGRLRKAETAYREALRLKPDLLEARLNLGSILYRMRRHKEAEAALREVIARGKHLPEAYANLGLVLNNLGRHKEAEAACRKAIRLLPEFLGSWSNLAVALNDQGRHKEAENLCREVIRRRPDFSPAHTNLAWALREQGRHKEAEAASREAIRLRPNSYHAHLSLAAALDAQHRDREAVLACREAIRLKPEASGGYNNLAVLLHNHGAFAEAEAACRKAISLDPGSAAPYVNLSNSLRAQGRPREAEALARQAIRLKPDYPHAHLHHGRALHDLGRFEEAEAAQRAALRLKPGWDKAHTCLGDALNSQGRFQEAEAAHRAAIRHNPASPDAHVALGNALQAQRRFAEAEAAARAALRLRPDYPTAHYNLGNALLRQGRFKEAEGAYRAAIRLKPDYADPHSNLCAALGAQGRFKEVEAAARAAIRLKLNYAEAHYNLGNGLLAQGRFREAEAAYRDTVRIKPDYAEAHCNLGHALKNQGRFPESARAFARGHALGTKQPGWRYPSAEWLREAESFAALEVRLSAVMRGDAEPASPTERLALARLCQLPAKRLHVTAARLAADAFEADPKSADDLNKQHRYNAACSAVLAAAGQAADAKPLPDKVTVALRRQALGWLRADLALYARSVERDNPKAKELVQRRLAHWQADADFTSVRDPEALARLPAAEREAWRQLWTDVEALRRRAAPGQ
jgi:serine/threonine-protein kinase